MTKQTRFHIWYWVAAVFDLLLVQYLVATAQQVASIPYSDFERYLDEGRIAEVAVYDRLIEGTPMELKNGRASCRERRRQYEYTTEVDVQFKKKKSKLEREQT